MELFPDNSSDHDYDKRYYNGICADTKNLTGFSPPTSSEFSSSISIPSNLLYDFSNKEEEDANILIKQQMITRYDKRMNFSHEDDIDDDLTYYYMIKCWNPFKQCDTSESNIRCMNVMCKSMCVLIIIILVSLGIVFVLHEMLNI